MSKPEVPEGKFLVSLRTTPLTMQEEALLLSLAALIRQMQDQAENTKDLEHARMLHGSATLVEQAALGNLPLGEFDKPEEAVAKIKDHISKNVVTEELKKHKEVEAQLHDFIKGDK